MTSCLRGVCVGGEGQQIGLRCRCQREAAWGGGGVRGSRLGGEQRGRSRGQWGVIMKSPCLMGHSLLDGSLRAVGDERQRL